MSVDDHGLEALRKAALQLTPGDKAEYKLRVILFDSDGNPLDPISVNIEAPTGPFEITPFQVTSVAANPLPTPLADRVALSIRNNSATVSIFVGKSAAVSTDTTAAGGGWEIKPREDLNFDMKEDTSFYLIAPTGQTAWVQIFEIAST